MGEALGSWSCILLHHSVLSLLSSSSQFDEHRICHFKRHVHRTCWKQSLQIREEDHPVFKKSVQRFSVSTKNLEFCQYELTSSPLSDAGSRERPSSANSGVIHIVSIWNFIFDNREHRSQDFSTIMFANFVWHGQVDCKFWTTVNALYGVDTIVGDAEYSKKNNQACYYFLGIIYADSGNR